MPSPFHLTEATYTSCFFDVDSNVILARPTKSKTSIELNAMVISMIFPLSRRGFKPKYYFLDNTIKELCKVTLCDFKISFEISPPSMHRRNVTGRAIQTFKTHVMCGLSSYIYCP